MADGRQGGVNKLAFELAKPESRLVRVEWLQSGVGVSSTRSALEMGDDGLGFDKIDQKEGCRII